MASLGAQNTFHQTVNNLQKSVSKLSTGLRINSAADDPSGLSISERMRTQIRGLSRASANAEDGVSMLQTAEGALNETHSILQRMRELAVQAANGTLTSNDRTEIQKEVDQLKLEVDRISTSTEFNTKKLLDGKGAGLWSSSDADTRAVIVGKVAEGNYKLSIDNAPGVNEVQKTDIFSYKYQTQSAQNFSAGTSATAAVSGPGVSHISAVLSTQDMIAGEVKPYSTSTTTFEIGASVDTLESTMYQTTLENTSTVRASVDVVGSYVDGGSSAQDGVDVKNIAFSTATGSTSGAVTAQYIQLEVLGSTTAVQTNQVSVRWSNDQGATWNIADTTNGVATLGSAAGTARALVISLSGSVTSGDRYLFSLTRSSAASWGDATGINTVDIRTNMVDINNYGTGRAVESVNTQFCGQQTFVGVGDAGSGTIIDRYKATVAGVQVGTATSTAITARASVVDVFDSDGSMNAHGFSIAMTNDIGTVTALSSRQGNLYVTVVNSALVTFHSDADQTERQATWGANYGTIVISDTATIFSGAGATLTVTLSAGTTAQASAGYKFVVNYHGSSSGTGVATALVQISGTKSNDYRESVVFNLSPAKDSAFFSWGSMTGIAATTAGLTVLRNNTTASGTVGYASQFSVAGVDCASGTFSQGSIELQFNKASLTTGVATFEVDDGVALRVVQSAYKTSTQVQYTIGTLDAKTGDFNFGTFKLSYGANYSTGTAQFDIDHSTGLAHGGTQLREIDKFYDANGVFVLGDHGQTITLFNGKGDSADIFIGAGDTMNGVAEKIQSALINDLGMTSGDAEVDKNLATFVDTPTSSGDEAVKGTIVIRSPWAGTNGKLMFSGPESVLNALSLVSIQDPADLEKTMGQMSINVTDAHTGVEIGSDSTTDGIMRNVIKGVEVGLDPNIDVKATWDSVNKKITFASDTGEATRFVHVVDNSMNLHIGANEGQTTGVYIGQMDTEGLRIQGILVTNQEGAEKAITTLDEAIQKVSSERARIGAYVNRLGTTINNLAVQEENMTAAESTIRDLNVAKEISKMTQLQMLQQMGSAMIAQANQIPSSLQSLLR